MWIRIRAVIIEDETLAARYLAALLDDTCQVEVVDTATESEAGLKLCGQT
jgi:DNA-binding NarL/FixJ family response regulator